jgi:hypothetical protein
MQGGEMTTPWEHLDRFERQHGEYFELLGQLTGDEKRDQETNKLLRRHHVLIVAAVAYQRGYDDGKRAALLAEPAPT